MKEKQLDELEEIFTPKRVSTKKRDLIPNSHDLASIPSFVKKRIKYEPSAVMNQVLLFNQ